MTSFAAQERTGVEADRICAVAQATGDARLDPGWVRRPHHVVESAARDEALAHRQRERMASSVAVLAEGICVLRNHVVFELTTTADQHDQSETDAGAERPGSEANEEDHHVPFGIPFDSPSRGCGD